VRRKACYALGYRPAQPEIEDTEVANQCPDERQYADSFNSNLPVYVWNRCNANEHRRSGAEKVPQCIFPDTHSEWGVSSLKLTPRLILVLKLLTGQLALTVSRRFVTQRCSRPLSGLDASFWASLPHRRTTRHG
jgi:hypothetical protein